MGDRCVHVTAGGRRLGLPGGGVRMEAELLTADPDHVAATENPRLRHPLAVDQDAVGAEIRQQVAPGTRGNVGMPTRDFGCRYHDLAAGIPADGDAALANRVFPTI